MAFTSTTNDNNITLVGTSGSDAFGNQGTASKAIKANGFDGLDSITVDATVSSGTIGMGGGIDTVTVSAVAKKLDVTMGAAADTFAVSAAADSITVGGQGGADTFTITGAALKSRFAGGQGKDTFTSTGLGTTTSIIGGSEVDTIGTSTTRFVAGTDSFINGQKGADSIFVTAVAGTTIHGGSEADTINQGADVTGTYLSGDKGADKITDAAADATILGGGGADTIAAGYGVDTITGGLGKDDFVINAIAGAATVEVDEIQDLTVADDQVGFDVSDLETFVNTGTGAVVNLTSAAAATTDIAGGTAASVTKVTAAYNLGTSGTGNVLAFGSSTAFTAATLSDALEVGGSLVLTMGTAFTAGDAFVAFYDDNADSYAALISGDAAVAAGASFAAADLTVTNIAKFEGIADATTIATANVLDFVA